MTHFVSEFSPSFVRVIQRLKPIVETWLKTKDSELEGRIYFRDSKSNKILPGVTKEWFEHFLHLFQVHMNETQENSIDTFYSNGIRKTEKKDGTHFYIQKKLIQRLDVDVKQKNCGFRIQLKTETKVDTISVLENQEESLQRRKKRSTFNPKGEFCYDFTIVKQSNMSDFLYEMEIEAIHKHLVYKDPTLIATSLVCKLIDWIHEKPQHVNLSILI
jgi:hypothetical protein